MVISNNEELIDGIKSIVLFLEQCDDLYVAYELAYQLQEEINQTVPDDNE